MLRLHELYRDNAHPTVRQLLRASTLGVFLNFEPHNDYDLLRLGLGGYEKITEENLVFCLDNDWLKYLQDQGMPDPAEAMRHIGEWLDCPAPQCLTGVSVEGSHCALCLCLIF